MMTRILTLVLLLLSLSASAEAWTRLEIRARSEWLLNQDSSATTKSYPDIMLNDFINAGIRFVSKATLGYRRDTVIYFNVRQTEYNMPSDFIKVTGVEIGAKRAASDQDQSPKGLTQKSPAEIGKDNNKRKFGPRGYRDKGETIGKIEFDKSPLRQDSARVTFAAYAPDLDDDTTECLLPDGYETVLPDYVAWNARKKTMSLGTHREDFLQGLAPLMQSDGERSQPEVPSELP